MILAPIPLVVKDKQKQIAKRLESGRELDLNFILSEESSDGEASKRKKQEAIVFPWYDQAIAHAREQCGAITA